MSRELALTISVYTSEDSDNIQIFREYSDGSMAGGVSDEETTAAIRRMLERN